MSPFSLDRERAGTVRNVCERKEAQRSQLKPPHHALHVQHDLSGVQSTQRVDSKRGHAVNPAGGQYGDLFSGGSAMLSLA